MKAQSATQSASAAVQLLRLPAVIQRTGYSRSSIYRAEAAGNFPKRVKLGAGLRGTAWVATEIDRFIAGLIASRDKEAAHSDAQQPAQGGA